MTQLGAVLRHEFRMLGRQMPLLLGALVMPLIVMVFLQPTFRLALRQAGVPGANGAEQSVPGVAVMFSFFMVGVVALAFLREHGFGTWDRLRASSASSWQIILGKLGPLAVAAVIQQVALFAVGVLGAGLVVNGSIVALACVAAALVGSVLALGVLLMAVCTTQQQITLFQLAGTMAAAGLGGAFTPPSLMPTAARVIGPCLPTYWAMRGYRTVILDGGGIGAVLLPVAMLVGFTALFGAIAVWRFRSEEPRPSWW